MNIPYLTGPIDPSMEVFNQLIQEINASIAAGGGGSVQSPVEYATTSSPTVINGDAYLAVTINGVAYNLALATPGS